MAHGTRLASWAVLALLVSGCVDGRRVDDANSTGGATTKPSTAATGGTRSSSTTNVSVAGAAGQGSSERCDLVRSCEPDPSKVPGTPVTTTLGDSDRQDLDQIASQLPELSSLTAEGFAARYSAGLSSASPSYDPSVATGMEPLQASSLALDTNELSQLKSRGFVITERKTFPSYVYGYETFYKLDLPLYVSADSVLYAIHQSFDSLLRDLETSSLIPALQRLLKSMRSSFDRARAAGVSEAALTDADFYLTVAASLLEGTEQAPVAGANSAEIRCVLKAASELDGCVLHDLFGVSRVFDFSQFTIRGHYTSDPELGRYFQTMMWLGRVDLRIIETQVDGTQVFNRRQLEAALAMRAMFDNNSRADWQRIDRVVEAFVGEHDSMILPQLDALMRDLGASSIAELASIPDASIAQAIIAGRYGTQRISSHIMATEETVVTLPLSSTFLLFGQRYVVDSHVFSNVVFDRVNVENIPKRWLPNPLDVAFAAFGNDQAGELLAPEIAKYAYAPELAKMRVLVDAHPASYWQANLYNHWIGALRALSTATEARSATSVGLPAVAGTEAWGRRLLNTQLASWSELRHDTLLYAKQSYTAAMVMCEYPDAYVEPYPAFWAQLVAFAEYGKALTAELGLTTSAQGAGRGVAAYFEKLRESTGILQQMAERQRTGAPHDAGHIAFINQAIRLSRGGGGCGGSADATDASGWYADLFYHAPDKVAYDPNIADVHTQPSDEVGTPVGRILHVGTGMPRLMVVTAENCTGPHAYVGLASSYFERITEDFKRLTDEEWSQELLGRTPPDVPWMSDIVVR